ncbi:MAG: purine-nucleoside phosphorylase [Sphaerochaetaceae bacterium]|nr:purine-nucleoside phosphorylase [Sphaerochaetaceae bacterium]MDD2406465.1 purine-nucleoside phosphorylase [Sphaerochaetaceae bacterium]MDD3671471.1 purine-nucleoside phosphorylase [Sphaerochaetaceae bacterium]MDD4258394.1 purine-nucleoside phosphorylase [Sphaerochaetaceae bacterium]MDD4842156.1 purine-nucleoside phosphorylase [Sphaerochaetaceae bacterium]
MGDLMKKLHEAADYVASKINNVPISIGMVLGSGLGDLANEVEDKIIIPYSEIPHFPVSTVVGHAGRLVIGKLSGKQVLVMQGRFHFYEGYPMDTVVFPVRMMRVLGIKDLLLTNAAGCVNTAWTPGDLMIISDHIKLIADNPLRGPNPDELGQRFFDMGTAYPAELRAVAHACGERLGIPLRDGIYQLFTGPSFETPAEVRFARMCGADAVGMSTVPEAIAARHAGMRVLGISCLTNMAAGILDQPLNHEEVLETGERVKNSFGTLVKAIVADWPVA